jgi:hypothetical protein
MTVNTANLEDYTTFSSVSLNGSGATLKALDLNVSRFTSTGTLIAQEVWASLVSAPAVATSTLTANKFFFSSSTTAQSASTVKVADAQLIISVLSLTTNGAAIYFRSGNSTYVWPASGTIG